MWNPGNRFRLRNCVAMLALSAPSLTAAQNLTLLNVVQDAGGTSVGRRVALDADGNAVVVGRFQGTTVLGTGGSAVTLTSAGSIDAFVARYAPDGSLLNAARAGGPDVDFAQGVAVDPSGNAVVTGYFRGTAIFGAGEANQTTLTSNGGSLDLYVARYAPNGLLVNAVRAGGSDDDVGNGVEVDASGIAVVTGLIHGTAIFGAGEANQTTLTGSGLSDIFVARYAPNGTLVNAVRAGGTGFDSGQDVAVDAGGNAVITGSFTGSATFGAGQVNQTTLSSNASSFDIFVARYSPTGTLIYAAKAGGAYVDQGLNVAVDPSGNAVVTGHFDDTATFGSDAGAVTLTNPGGSEEVFVARYDLNGSLLNVVRAGGANQDRATGVGVDAGGNAVVTGTFESTATFGSAPNAVTLTSDGLKDVFVARYASDGSLVSAVRAGGTDNDYAEGVAVASGGNAVVTGYFSGTATFGPGDPNQTTLTSSGIADVFVARYTLTADAPLPVELSSFTGSGRDGSVALNWTTATETDNAGFVVLRDGLEIASYRTLASLRGHGTTANRSAYVFADSRVQTGRSYTYTLRSVNLDGTTHDYGHTVEVLVEAVAPPPVLPTSFALLSAAPNPFNPATTIRFDLPTAGTVQATLFDALGRAVRTVGGEFAAGAGQALALDASGLPSGAYVVRLTAGASTQTVRVTLAK